MDPRGRGAGAAPVQPDDPRAPIGSPLRDYLPFLTSFRASGIAAPALDLGCGGGDWTGLLRGLGFDAHGIERGAARPAGALQGETDTQPQDALEALRAVPDASRCVIAGFDVAGHVALEDLLVLTRQAMRALIPGGLLILGIPDAGDAARRNPLPPEILAFVASHVGFGKVRILRSRRDRPGAEEQADGPGGDCGLVAQKPGGASDANLPDEVWDAALAVDHAGRDDRSGSAGQLARLSEALAWTNGVLGKSREDLRSTLARMAELQLQVELLKRSTSWRVTAPLRAIRRAASRLFAKGGLQLPGSVAQALVGDGPAGDEPRSVQFAYRRLVSYRAAGDDTDPEGTDRPRLAYFSPMPPQRSGISDYSAELLPALSEYYAIDVIVEDVRAIDEPVGAAWVARDLRWFREHACRYDRILYHLGNSPFHCHMVPIMERYPGVVVLHDFHLGDLVNQLADNGDVRYRANALQWSHGYGAVLEHLVADPAAGVASSHPANCHFLECAQGVIVHSEHARQLARKFFQPSFSAQWAVIASLRNLPERPDRAAVRRSLGFSETDFVICSFGVLGETKLNHRLVSALLGSSLAADETCRLVFVGECTDGPYGLRLRGEIAKAKGRAKIEITGYASRALYEQYLGAADLAIQLRERSRGETSAAVLDCMGFALPVIVNAHGAMAELPEGTVVKLEEDFRDADLAQAVEQLRHDAGVRRRLGEAARGHVAQACSPTVVARSYRAAIERFAAEAPPLFDGKALASLARQLPGEDARGEGWLRAARAIADQCSARRGMRQLLVDVSVVAGDDYGTGIQRVVRSQLMGLLQGPPEYFRVEPVRLVHERGRWEYRYARTYAAGLLGLPGRWFEDDVVDVSPGDILLVADFFTAGVIGASEQGLYYDWKTRGVGVNFMVYDILPISLPQYFPPGTDEDHARWIAHAAANADRLICISNAVAEETRDWLSRRQGAIPPDLEICAVHLGADIDASAPTTGLPAEADAVLSEISSRPSFLMVGTVEPRKGHLQALAAFEALWRRGVDVNLVIVGAEGWKHLPDDRRRTIPRIVAAIRQSAELGRRLLWLDGISDEYLAEIYKNSSCLLAASEDEGFGLPLIEAARHGIAILARDIPVFREIGEHHVDYFRGLLPADLERAVEAWLVLWRDHRQARSADMGWLTWKESVGRLEAILVARHGPAGDADTDSAASAPSPARKPIERAEP